MLDIKIIKNDPKYVKQAMKNRQKDFDKDIDEILNIDVKRREFIGKTESIKAKQNLASKKIPAMKKAGEDTTTVFAEMKKLSDEAAVLDTELSKLEEAQKDIILGIPNIPDKSVPIGKDSDDNVEIRRWGEPKKFDFEALPHWDLGKNLGILDQERAAKVTGARFHFYKGLGAKLERAIISFFLDTHTKNGYEELFPPYIINRKSLYGTGQLPKFDCDNMFKLEGLDYYLSPTAEVQVTNYHADEILWSKDLTKKYCAYSGCFRAEVGSAGRDVRGLIRQHQFNKVELVKLCKPEDSFVELETLTNDAEKLLQLLGLPYRVVLLCSGDMGFCSAKTYDIEVWMPSYNRYVEISSCSNFLDYQARRTKIRFKNEQGDKAQLVHTLNGSGLAVGRTFAAILENFQTKDGQILIPEVLKGYMGVGKI